MSLTISQHNHIHTTLTNEGIDLQDPNLNLRKSYTHYLERKVDNLMSELNATDDQLQSAERINAIMIMLILIGLAVFAISGGVAHV